MTKRFTYMEQFNGFCDVYDDGEVLSCMRLEYVNKTVKLLNGLYEENKELKDENKQLKKEKKELKELVREVDNELEIRDIVCNAGKFRLEEWGKRRYHQFYKCDEELEDESVVIMLMELEKENKELKKENEELKKDCKSYTWYKEYKKLLNENEQLKQQLTSINQLIDKKIDEFKHGYYGDLPFNTIHMFLDLKQEIGDVE